MSSYRLTTETGDVVATTTADDDRAAISWRSAHPFSGDPTPDVEGRHLRLEKQVGDDWLELHAGGTAEDR